MIFGNLTSLKYPGRNTSATIISPGGRASACLTVFEDSREIVPFGGNSESGPVSDVWVYDIQS